MSHQESPSYSTVPRIYYIDNQPENSAFQTLFLDRLRFLREKLAKYDKLNNEGVRLLKKSLFSSYIDCHTVGMEDEAKTILRTSIPDSAYEQTVSPPAVSAQK